MSDSTVYVQLEEAATEVGYEIQRMLELDEVPQLRQIRYWRDRLGGALAPLGPPASGISEWVAGHLDHHSEAEG
jgi:hypothetical protein